MPSKADTAVARTIGIDTGKNTLHMIGLDERGAIVLREKISRARIAARFVNLPPCLVGIEAGMASHYVARELVALGHEVKQVPPAYSKTIPARSQERLPGCARGGRSCRAPFDALCSD
jgi:transposase